VGRYSRRSTVEADPGSARLDVRPRIGHAAAVGAPSLEVATQLGTDPAQPGRFHAHISDDWTIVHVFGGVSMYITLRAMREALHRDDLLPLSCTAMFLAPIPAGPLTIDVDILRAGRTTTQLTADLRVADQTSPALHMQAIFGATRAAELTYANVRCPDVPRPNEIAVRRHSPVVHFNFDDRTEWRPISGLDDPHSTNVLAWERLQVGEPDLLSLALHSDVLGLAVEQQGPYTVLSLEIAIRFVAIPTTPWVLQEIEAWHVADGYATGPARLWDESGRLCAIVHQTAQVRPMHTS